MSKNRAGPYSISLKRAKITTFNIKTLPKEPGSYVLILKNNRSQAISVGRLGKITFEAGIYVYAGSAMGGISKRVSRYFKYISNPFWHIDRLIPIFQLLSLWLFPSNIRHECQIARLLSQMKGAKAISGFGSTDCHCPSHLFHFTNLKEMPLFLKIKKILNCNDAVVFHL